MIERFVTAALAAACLFASQPVANAQSSGQAALDAAYAELAAAQAELAAAQSQQASADQTATHLRGSRNFQHEANWRAQQDARRRINDLQAQQPRNDAAIAATMAELENLIAADAAADRALNEAEWAAVTALSAVEQAQARVAAAQAQIAALQQGTQTTSSAPAQQQPASARPLFAPAPPLIVPPGAGRPMIGATQPQGIYAPTATTPFVPRPPGIYSGARPIPPIAQPSPQRFGWPQRAGVSVVPGTMQRPLSLSRPSFSAAARPVPAHHVTPNKPLFYRAPSIQRSHQFASRPSSASVPRPSAPRYPVPTQRISRNSVLAPSAATRSSSAGSAYRSVSRPTVTTGTMRRR